MMQSLFERLADAHTWRLEATELEQDRCRLSVWTGDSRVIVEAELRCAVLLEVLDDVGDRQRRVPAVRVKQEGCPDVLMSAIPSAILAVILR